MRDAVRAATTEVMPTASALPPLFGAQGGVVLLTIGMMEEEELVPKEGRVAVVVETKEGRGWPPVFF